jgi:hypothetical protein
MVQAIFFVAAACALLTAARAQSIAYTNSTSAGKILVLYARVTGSTVNNQNTWPAAQSLCQALPGGNLAPISSGAQLVAIQQLMAYLTTRPSGVGLPYGVGSKATPLCSWFGYSTLAGESFSGGGSLTYLKTLPTSSAIYFDDFAKCGAICNGSPGWVSRDCDFEAQNFVCEIDGNTAAGDYVPPAPPTPSSPPPAYPPAYSPPPSSMYPPPAYPASYPPPSYPSPSYPATYPPPVYSSPPPAPAPPVAPSTFTKCAIFNGFNYCASTYDSSAASPNVNPFPWADASTICSQKMGASSVYIGTDLELAFIRTNFPLSANTIGYWTAGAKPGGDLNRPAYVTPTIPNTNSTAWLSSQTILPTTSMFNPVYPWPRYGFDSNFVGNCASGNGCGVALVFSSAGSVLQYVDTAFSLSILCKAPVNFPPASPYPSSAPPTTSTPRVNGQEYVYLPISVKLLLGIGPCQQIQANPASFDFQFSTVTAGSWNGAVQNIPILDGDVPVTGHSYSCVASGRRSLFQAGTSVSTNANTNMPPGVTATQANGNRAAFRNAALNSYQSGQFASNFGVTGAEMTVDPAVTATYYSPSSSSSSNNNLALGLGLGLGLGIPILIGGGFGAYYWYKRRDAQQVGSAEHESLTAPAEVTPQ